MITAFIGTSELIIIGAIVLLLFGGAKLPGLMRSLGRSVNSFKQGLNDSLPPDTNDGQAHNSDEK